MRLRPLSESECYARCYGRRGDETVRVIRVEPRRPRYDITPLTGEAVRRLFAERLETREPEAA